TQRWRPGWGEIRPSQPSHVGPSQPVPQAWLTEAPITVKPRRAYGAEVVRDGKLHEATVTIDRQTVPEFFYYVHPGGHDSVGCNPLSDSVSKRYPADVHQ